jgi:putative transposase
MRDRLKRALAGEALPRAIATGNPSPRLVHHSDRGSHDCPVDRQAPFPDHGIMFSMSGRGDCCDKSMVETFFKTIMSKLIWPFGRASPWQTRGRTQAEFL